MAATVGHLEGTRKLLDAGAAVDDISTVSLVGWFAGWLVGWLVGWLAGRLVGCLTSL